MQYLKLLFKLACTSGPYSSKIMNKYQVFSAEKIVYEVDVMIDRLR